MYKYIKYKLLQNPTSLANLPDIKEGLDNRILSCIMVSANYDHFLETVKTKRYTYTRIARCLCQYFIGFELFDTEALRKASPEYVRILGFNKTGAKMLKEAKKSSDIEIITKLRDIENPMLQLDILSTRMYSLINNSISMDSDFKKSPIIYNSL
jgi:predicted nucleotidyltransferase